MQVQVRGKGVVVTDALREYADRKVNKLTKHFSNLTNATVTETIQGTQHRVEVQLEGDGVKLRCEERGDDLYAAVDRVVDKLDRQMHKHKSRNSHRSGGHANGHKGNGSAAAVARAAMADGVLDGDAVPAQQTGGRHHHHYGHHGEVVSPRTAPVVIDGLEDEPATGRIVRTKRFGIKPISPDEAVEEMELLSHDFFVFENAQTGEVNVLYRREDGNYGILEPER
jgi:putative sigma-54 modulation protein